MKYIPQYDASDCGAACLSMIMTHYGSHWPVSKIRDVAGTDRHGTNLKGMIIAAEALGFEAKALKSTSNILKSNLPTPFIAHLNKPTGTHFIVVYKIKKDKVWIADPDPTIKKQVIQKSDFERDWTGYAIFLNPTPNFNFKKEKKHRLSRFLPLFRPHLGAIIQSLIASIILTLLGIISSFYFSYLVDTILPSKADFALHTLSIGVIILTFFQFGLNGIRDFILIHFSQKTSIALNFTYLKHVLSQPMKFFDSRKVGEILSRFGDGERVRGILSSVAISVVMDIFMMLVAGIFLMTQNLVLFGVAMTSIPLSTAIIWFFSGFFRKNYRKFMHQDSESQSFMVETLNGMATIKGLNSSEQAFNKIEKLIIRSTKTGFKGEIVGTIQKFLVGLVNGWGGNVLFWVGSYLILGDHISLGTLIAFNALLGFFLGPLQRLLGLQTDIQEALVAADRIGEILELPSEVEKSESRLRPKYFQGGFKLNNIDFRYGARNLIIQDLSLHIPASNKVAFVGPSGCGKSTLVKLLLKFYNVEKGEILLDENNLLDLDTEHLRSRIGYVPQEVFLFSGSVLENISLHKPDANYEQIVEASKRAQAHDFINNLPERYNTVISERGFSFSGGERQRLALARALLGKPDILIFDEATSNLDVIAEKLIHETIIKLSNEGLTTILVAHRLSTVLDCDKIFVMDQGRIIEEGRHLDLIKNNGPYSKLWEYQKL
jgi:ABC-type bacteriocin transporter